MKYRKLGRTDVEASAVCAGCMTIGHDKATYGPTDLDDALAAVDAYIEAGVNFLDTAESYAGGASEEALGKHLGRRRKELVLATKVSPSHLTRAGVRAACEASLRRLKTDVIDLYQVHWPNPDVPLAETMAALKDLQAAGKVRFIGVSNFGVSYLTEALAAGDVQTDQVPYNLLWRAIEQELQPLCVERGVGILCYSPMCQGLLTGKFRSADDVPEGRARSRLFADARPRSRHGQTGFEEGTFAAIEAVRKLCEANHLPMAHAALAWAMQRPAVTAVIAGARNADQARQNVRAAELELPADLVASLEQATEPVKQYVGNNVDMWEAPSRMEK